MTGPAAWKAITTAAVLCIASGARAYGPEGHETVGAIADRLLQGTPTEAAIKQLLGTNLQIVSVWADCAKSVKSGSFKKNPQFPECDKFDSEKARLEDYVARNGAHTAYHYTDVSNLHRDYDSAYAGAETKDIVHAVNAAIVVLRGQATPQPFKFGDKREALSLLSHYIGDLHQPLHTVALYLDDNGAPIDPDRVKDARDLPPFETIGGNALRLTKGNLHSKWDGVPSELQAGGARFEQMVSDARFVPRPSGNVMTWSRQWASESIQLGTVAFEGLRFGTSALDAEKRKYWPTTFIDEPGYTARADALKQLELTRAGARLAQLLQEVLDPLPQSCSPGLPGKDGYIPRASMPDIRAWVAPAPDALSVAQLLDDKIYESTRPLVATARGQSAAEDDVYDKDQVLDRFLPSIGSPKLSNTARKSLETIIDTMERDAANLVEPLKKKVCEGGRVRPFVAKPGTPTCLAPVDLAGHADSDQITFGLATSGAYPSTHATIGILIGLLLAELFPDKAQAAIARGLEFGQSRVICGFHYQSDVDAGRLAGAALLARIKSSDRFKEDWADLRNSLSLKP